MRIKGKVRIQLLLPICTGLPDLPGLPGSWLSRRGHTGHNLQKLDRSELKEEFSWGRAVQESGREGKQGGRRR